MSSRRQELRLQAIAVLGGKCVQCGEDDSVVLDIDHIDGVKDRRLDSNERLFKSIIASDRTDLQLLCVCCHTLKHAGCIYIKRQGRYTRYTISRVTVKVRVEYNTLAKVAREAKYKAQVGREKPRCSECNRLLLKRGTRSDDSYAIDASYTHKLWVRDWENPPQYIIDAARGKGYIEETIQICDDCLDDDDYMPCLNPDSYDGGFGIGSYFDHAMQKED